MNVSFVVCVEVNNDGNVSIVPMHTINANIYFVPCVGPKKMPKHRYNIISRPSYNCIELSCLRIMISPSKALRANRFSSNESSVLASYFSFRKISYYFVSRKDEKEEKDQNLE